MWLKNQEGDLLNLARHEAVILNDELYTEDKAAKVEVVLGGASVWTIYKGTLEECERAMSYIETQIMVGSRVIDLGLLA